MSSAKLVEARGLIGALNRIIAQEKAVVPTWLRRPADLATRAIPAPKLPGGENHRLSNVYYYKRDARRTPIAVARFGNTKNTPLIAPVAVEGESAAVEPVSVPVGPVFAGRSIWPPRK